MKHLFAILLLAFSFSVFSQETFTVLFIKGDVTINGAPVARGAKISTTDEVKYGTEQDMLAAISPAKGRVILKPQPDKAKANGELAFVINDIFMPVKSNAMTRAIGDDMGFADDFVVQAYFSRRQLALLDTTGIAFDLEEYPMDDSHGFSINLDGKIYDLPYDDNKALIVPQEIFEGDEIPEEADLELLYNDGGDRRKVADLHVLIPDFDALVEEIEIIKKSGLDHPWNNVSSYIQDTYGHTDQSRLQAIFLSIQ